MNPKLIVFDMDGLLVDTEPFHMKMFHKFLNENDVKVDRAWYYQLIGVSNEEWYARIMNVWPTKISKETLSRIFRSFRENYKLSYKEVFRHEVLEVFNYLKEAHIKVALASSSSKETIIRIL